ncbi:hypothetical protein MPH_00866 [Macrophomina phaseolina MS6]|uniref:Uncharacterized protein n=1 Tax=Macrophomina phaseolina (strain MS6) TaxID=1126212 RepID=K2SZ98_MACPH|nr:hypothetical protein MPH_00866 [Macrophomina phaseolina MS6]
MLFLLTALFLQLPRYVVFAHPVLPDSVDTSIEPTQLLLCTGPHFTGDCTHQNVTALGNDHCLSLDGTAMSVQPGSGLDCMFYANGVCRTFLDPAGESLRLFYPGEEDLSGRWSPLSYSCVQLNGTVFAEEAEEGDGV